MELKPYQQEVINHLALFLRQVQKSKELKTAFQNFWSEHPETPLFPFPGSSIEPYKNNISGVPHICVKVPTAGGKTFIACNAIKTIFDAFDYDRPKAVVWLVPSITILEQTIKNLKDPSHPYRQKINAHFGNKVEVFDKTALLQGSGFNVGTVKEQLSIMVFSFDSLRAKNKEDRKVFQENGNLYSFESVLDRHIEITLGSVIQHLNPVVIVDESHNAESELSVDMLKAINPCFILDLTATPRKNSNIISFIDALALKKENMVKLPVIVYNHQDKTEVIHSALQLQRRLEMQAKEEERKGGRYIRPIVLFQAQPKNANDNTTFEKLKEKLIELKIPAEQIKIKTAYLNELKHVDLMSRDCEVRYIITVNALKEGWDCPFAYILASLADKSSAVDVEQILGRVLRQPYVMKHNFPLLNLSYVLTASGRFMDTLDNIVKGLNKAGFSDKDYKLADPAMLSQSKPHEVFTQLSMGGGDESADDDVLADIDVNRILHIEDEKEVSVETVSKIEQTANEQITAFEKGVRQMEELRSVSLPNELQQLVKTYRIKDIFKEEAESLCLPQFYLKVPGSDLFGTKEELLLDKEYLLEEFRLSQQPADIRFNNITAQLYRVDLDETKKEHTPTPFKIDGTLKESLISYMLDPDRKGSRIKNFTSRIMNIIGNMYPIVDKEIERYVNRILEDFTDEQFADFTNNEYTYTDKIREKIRSLSELYAEKKFREYLDTDKIIIKSCYTLPPQIVPGETSREIPKTLYEKEGKMNGFEERIINEIANLNSVAFWTRNIERRGFRINGFINHYPDFIIYTKSGKILILETKGDHLDAEQKIRLGTLWAGKAGNNFRYFMVYDRRVVDGAYTVDDFLNVIREM